VSDNGRMTSSISPHERTGHFAGAFLLLRNLLWWKSFQAPGVVAEWLKAAVLKTAKGESPS
jgi:hypothetical protein